MTVTVNMTMTEVTMTDLTVDLICDRNCDHDIDNVDRYVKDNRYITCYR